MIRRATVVLVGLLAACGSHAPAPAADASGPVVLQNGPNAVAPFGDSTRGQVFVAWRDNGNAHGFSTVAFYVLAPAQPEAGDTSRTWQIIPFFGGPDDPVTGREFFTTTEGADCTLGDLRVLRNQGAPLEVVLAEREPGESFADSAAVKFDYYRAVRTDGGNPGRPTYYFEHMRTVPAKRSYCDVNEAFRSELGLGAAGLGHGEGGQ